MTRLPCHNGRRRIHPSSVIRHPLCPIRLAICLCLLLTAGTGKGIAGPTGEVVAEKLHLRAGPGPDQPSVTILKRGTRFEVLEKRADWLKITSQGHTGFVKQRPQYLRLDGTEGQAGAPQDQKAAAAKAEAADVAAKIARSRQQVKETARREENAVEQLAAIEAQLHALRTNVETLQRELARRQEAVRAAEAESRTLEQRLQDDQRYAVKRLRAYYKMMVVGRAHILASASNVYDMLAREKAMGRIVAEDEALLTRLAADQSRQAVLVAELKEAQATRLRLQAELTTQAGRLDAEKAQRRVLLDQIRADKSLQTAALDALQRQAQDLERRIAAINREAAATGPALEPNSKPFQELKGLLNLPVSGMMVTRFGAYRNEALNVTHFRSGVDIKTEAGAQVRAVGGGKVLFAEPFRGYGNMVIIDHGDSYYTVYAQLDRLVKLKGQAVAAGEALGTVGDAGLEGFPKLYFEVRHHGKPQDPAEWLKKN